MGVKDRLKGLDEAQQRRPAMAIPIATAKKFVEDKTAQMASMVAFWAFFSIFPLLLATITVLGYVLPKRDKQRVLKEIGNYVSLLDVSTVAGLQAAWSRSSSVWRRRSGAGPPSSGPRRTRSTPCGRFRRSSVPTWSRRCCEASSPWPPSVSA